MKATDRTRKGLDEERKLPETFTAKTDFSAGTVEIESRGGGKVTIPMGSYASVANVLAEIWPDAEPSLESGSTLRIADGFSGKSASITAGALKDVVAAIEGLVRKKEAPSPAKATQEALESRKPATQTTKPSAAPKAVKAARKTKGKAAGADAPKPVSSDAPKSHVNLPAPDSGPDMPAWMNDLKEVYHADNESGPGFDLVRARISLDGPKSRTVTGRTSANDKAAAWGYEVLSEGGHVAWVIAENERSLVITGVPDYVPSVHRIIPGVIARISISVLPKVMGKAA